MTDRTPGEELTAFRADLYRCCTRWPDALFELSDALLCADGPVTSLPQLSLEAEFSRSHGSLYKALREGRIDTERFRRLLVANRPKEWPLVFAIDASTWARPDAETSAERGFYHSASHHSAGRPIACGWSYQWCSQVNFAPDSWSAPLDVRRLVPLCDQVAETVEQIKGVLALLPKSGEVPLFVHDAGYDGTALGYELKDERCEILVRLRSDRVVYADPPQRPPGTTGRPRRHGRQMKCSDPASFSAPDDEIVFSDFRYGTITVSAFSGLHPKLGRTGHWKSHQRPPIVRGTVIRVDVEHLPRPTTRAKKTLWLWWSGPGKPDLRRCVEAYLHRFDEEHGFRFVKGTLGWVTPSLMTPEQADRWTLLVVAAFTELRLARGLVVDHRLPWEKPREPGKLTPCRVRRGFCRLRATLGTPANPPKSTKAGPGRPKGSRKPPRTRYPAVKRAP